MTAAPIALLAAAAFCSATALRVCDPLLPRLAQDFGRSVGETGGLIVVFAMAYGGVQIALGPLADRYGKHRMMAIALVGCALASAAAALAPTYDTLWLLRIAWGLAAGGIIPLAMAWIGDAVPDAERQTTLARLLLGTVTGMVAGQLLGGLFAQTRPGWRGAFLTLAAGYAVIAALLVARHARRPVAQAAVVPLGHGVPAVLRSPWARRVLATVFVEGVCLLGPLSYLPSYLHHREGLSLRAASIVAALYAMGGFLYAAFARRIVPALGEHRMVAGGGVLMAAGMAGLALLPQPAVAGVLVVTVGFGTYLFHATLQTHATQMAPGARGTAVSLFAFALFAGQATGVSLFGPVLDARGYGVLWLLPAAVLLVTGCAYPRLAERARRG